MSVTIPPILVLIVCKTVIAGPLDQNAAFTKHENRDWAIENSMMVCRRHETQLYDPAEGQKLNPQDDPAFPLRPNFFDYSQCARAGIMLSQQWDEAHRNGNWRVWRVGCPTPVINNRGELIGYKLPDCGHRDTVVCENDSVI